MKQLVTFICVVLMFNLSFYSCEADDIGATTSTYVTVDHVAADVCCGEVGQLPDDPDDEETASDKSSTSATAKSFCGEVGQLPDDPDDD